MLLRIELCLFAEKGEVGGAYFAEVEAL